MPLPPPGLGPPPNPGGGLLRQACSECACWPPLVQEQRHCSATDTNVGGGDIHGPTPGGDFADDAAYEAALLTETGATGRTYYDNDDSQVPSPPDGDLADDSAYEAALPTEAGAAGTDNYDNDNSQVPTPPAGDLADDAAYEAASCQEKLPECEHHYKEVVNELNKCLAETEQCQSEPPAAPNYGAVEWRDYIVIFLVAYLAGVISQPHLKSCYGRLAPAVVAYYGAILTLILPLAVPGHGDRVSAGRMENRCGSINVCLFMLLRLQSAAL